MDKSLYTDQGKTLRKWLKKARIDAGLTVRDLGARLNVHFQAISKIESGERRLDIVEYVVYCRALEVDPQIGIAAVARSLTARKGTKLRR